jgi:phytepsin
MGIESVVNEHAQKASDGFHDAMCSTCEMAVVWMQNQLKQNQTQERILDYVNEVNQPWLYLAYSRELMHTHGLIL